jgi:hypothetical protein
MGFRAAIAAAPKPKMALIARVESTENMAQLADHLTAADAVIVAQIGVGKVPGVVWGLWSDDLNRQQIKAAAEAGADFIILSLNLEFGLPGIEKMGKILLAESSLSDGLIRTINELPAEAVLLAGEEGAITWHQLMLCQRVSDLLIKPLLVTVSASVGGDELRALWKAGVDGVVTSVKTAKSAERLKELRQVIDKSDFAARPRKKMAAIVPRIHEETGAVATDVEEEEEEE